MISRNLQYEIPPSCPRRFATPSAASKRPRVTEGSSWGAALTTIAACGGAGALIDFWIRKSGQQRVRGWLETWWLRLSYVRWGNFGREEALFAAQVMPKLV